MHVRTVRIECIVVRAVLRCLRVEFVARVGRVIIVRARVAEEWRLAVHIGRVSAIELFVCVAYKACFINFLLIFIQ